MPARTPAELFVLAAARIHLLGVETAARLKSLERGFGMGKRSALDLDWAVYLYQSLVSWYVPRSFTGASKIRAPQIRRCSSSEHHPMGPRSSAHHDFDGA